MANAETRLPSKKTGNGRHKQEIRGADLYPTPAPLTEALLRVEPLPHRIWEPAAGMGHMSSVLKAAGHRVFSSDLISYGTDGVFIQDFFDFKAAPAGSSCIVTNPPFSVAEKFIRHGLELCPSVVILARLAFIESDSRSDIIDTKLARVYPFVERAPMMHRWSQGLYERCDRCLGDGCEACESGVILIEQDGIWREWAGKKSSSAMPMAWFVFERDHDADRPTILKRIRHSKAKPIKVMQQLDLEIPSSSREDGKLVLT